MNYKKELEEFFLANNIRTYNIEYYPKIFGNLVVKFQYNGVEHCLITDRDETICSVSLGVLHSKYNSKSYGKLIIGFFICSQCLLKVN